VESCTKVEKIAPFAIND